MPLRSATNSDDVPKITHPNQLQAAIKADEIQLVLLQPLANMDVFTACRNPGSKFIRDQDGNRCGPSNTEYLDIAPLSKMWRQAFVPLLSQMAGKTIIFDAAQPVMDLGIVNDTSDYPEKIYFGTSPSGDAGGIHVEEMCFARLALTLIGEMRMKTAGMIRTFAVWDLEQDPSRTRGQGHLDSFLKFDGLGNDDTG